MWDYVKRPNLLLIGVPESDEENEAKLENTLQDIIQENFSNLETHFFKDLCVDIPERMGVYTVVRNIWF